MLTNAKVGTKLLALIVAPVMVLLAVASLGARDRLDDAADAEQVQAAAELSAATDGLIRNLANERLLTTSQLSADPGQDLTAARAATDDAIDTVRPALSSTAVPAAASDRIEPARRQLADLDDLRTSIDRGDAQADVVIDGYGKVIDELVRLGGEVAAGTSAAELSLALADASVLTRAQEARSELAARGVVAIGASEFEGGDLETFTALYAEERRLLARFTDGAAGASITSLRNALATPEAVAGDSQVEAMISNATIGGPGEPEVELDAWIEGQTAWLETVGAVDASLVGDVITAAGDQAFDATKAARLFMIATAGATILSILLAVWVARSIDRPLRRLTDAADDLATDRLPRLVENLRSPEAAAEEIEPFEPIEVTSADEIGQLTEAFNAIQHVTVTVAEEQSTLLRKGIGDIFVNLARRNQSLLDRQIEFIDELESKERDPDLLENLFRLDHLATRMRRNAESLLVLAGAEPTRRRAKPVALGDVLRVALGEVEDFTRIELHQVDEAIVAGNLAVDLSHLLSELMENATHFSPPETAVEVAGQFGPAGAYILSVADHGIGMSGEQLADANAMLASPPLVGLALGRSLGFIVVGRIAARLGLRVHLNASPAGGVTAVISMPSDLVARPGEEEPRDPVLDRGHQRDAAATRASPPATQQSLVPEPAVIERPQVEPTPLGGPPASLEQAMDAPPPPAPPEPPVVDIEPVPLTTEEPQPLLEQPVEPIAPAAPLPARAAPPVDGHGLADALPEGEEFEAGLASLIGPEASEDDVEHQFWGDLADEDAEPEPPAHPASAAAHPDTPTELTRRVPGAANAPAVPEGPSVDAPRRSPEEVRAMLSRYRDGKKAPPAPGDGQDATSPEDAR